MTWARRTGVLARVLAALSLTVVLAGSPASAQMTDTSVGQVVAWGDNSAGQLNVPQGLSNVVAVAAGGAHSLALRRDGTVVAWGNDDAGQATPPTGLRRVVAIDAGPGWSLALRDHGIPVTWGHETGDGPLAVPEGLDEVVAIAAGARHAVALRRDGSVVAWGDNHAGQTDVPLGLHDATTIAAGGARSAALRADGSTLVWGYRPELDHPSLSGRAGPGPHPLDDLRERARYGLANAADNASHSTLLSAEPRVALAVGPAHTLALRADGSAIASGPAENPAARTPERVMDLRGIDRISAGDAHNLALRAGQVIAWGATGPQSRNVTRVPKDLRRVVAIDAGSLHNLAIVH